MVPAPPINREILPGLSLTRCHKLLKLEATPMNLLTNAVESIQVGVEDYRLGTRARLLSSVRNIHAGILLLYKEALVRRSPDNSNEVLIKAKMEPQTRPDGTIVFVGAGKKTVDIQQLKERFKSLGITSDWKQFDKITDVRNDIEHYYPSVTQEALNGIIASALSIIRRFTREELEEEPYELLGHETWKVMLERAEVYQPERDECDAELDQVNWQTDVLAQGVTDLRCDDCGSDLLHPLTASDDPAEITLECRACGNMMKAESFVPEAVAAALYNDIYLSLSEGSDEPVGACPSCGTESFIMSEGRCAFCGEEIDTTCDRCGSAIPASELGSAPLCGYCDYMSSKDD